MEKRIAYNKLYHCINVLYSYSYDAITEKDTLRDQRKNPLVIPGRGEKKEAFKIYQSVLVFKHIMLLSKT